MTISTAYQQQLEQKHEQTPEWGSDGGRFAAMICELMSNYKLSSFLDYGCGKSDLSSRVLEHLKANRTGIFSFLKRADVEAYDPAIRLHCEKPKRTFDLVACIDVLEHIEPEHLLGVLEELHLYADNLVYLVVNTAPVINLLPDGRNAHLIQQKTDWWMEILGCFWDLDDPVVLDDRTFSVIGVPLVHQQVEKLKAGMMASKLPTLGKQTAKRRPLWL